MKTYLLIIPNTSTVAVASKLTFIQVRGREDCDDKLSTNKYKYRRASSRTT